jgi:hypothetical protein
MSSLFDDDDIPVAVNVRPIRPDEPGITGSAYVCGQLVFGAVVAGVFYNELTPFGTKDFFSWIKHPAANGKRMLEYRLYGAPETEGRVESPYSTPLWSQP